MAKSGSEIKIEVQLNEKKHPAKIIWTAGGPEKPESRDSKAMLLSFFDELSKETFKIDLWTDKMQVAEMDRFVYHSLNSLSDTYQQATGNTEMANKMKSFARHFGEETQIIPTE